MQLDNNSLIMQWNVDLNGNPVSRHIQREVQQVSPTHNLIQLTQIPDSYYPIRIVTEDNIELSEVKHRNDVTETTFCVEYGLGLVYFHESLKGKMIIINYYGRGVMLISDSRIFHKDGDTIADTWDNILERAKDALDLIEHAGGLAGAIEIIDDKIEEGTKVADRLEHFITETQFYGYTITLSREAFVVKADDNGEVGKTEISSVFTDVIVYKGAKQIIPTLSIAEEYNCTFKIEGQRVKLTNLDINAIKSSAVLNIDCGDGLICQRVLEVTKVFDGVNQYQVTMTNPFYSFQANSEGFIENSQSVECVLKVTKANIDYTNYSIQVQNVPQGLNYKIGAEGVVFTGIEGRLLPSSGTCLVVVSIDGQTFNNSFSWNKHRNGQDAKSLTLVGGQILRYNSSDFSGIPSPSQSTVSAKIVGLSGTPQWSFYDGINWNIIENATATDLTFIHNDETIWNNRKEVTIKCELDGYFDELTIIKLSSGTNGSDAISVILTNESHTVPIDDSGYVLESEITKAKTTVLAYKGTQSAVPTITKGKCEGCDISISGNVVQLVSLDNSFTSSTAELLVDVDGVAITKLWTISKSRQGQQGQDGANGSSYILNVTGGSRSIAYSQINQDPRPSTSSTFIGALYENGQEIEEGVSWYWVANGHYQGSSVSGSFTPTIVKMFDESIYENSISVTATYNGQILTQTLPLSVTKDASGLDWIQQWDSTKTEVRGNLILTPKLFAGHYDQDNDLITGVAIGQDVLNNGRTVGVVGYQNNEATFVLDVDGSVQIGNPFEESSVGIHYNKGKLTAKLSELTIQGVDVATKEDVTDLITSEVNSAKDEISQTIGTVTDVVDSLKNTVENTLKDGILTEVEKGELRILFNTLNGEMTIFSSQVSSILGSPFLSNITLLESLTASYDGYIETYLILQEVYNRIMETTTPTDEDIALFNEKLLALRTYSEELNQILIDCLTNISQEQATYLVDQAKEEIKVEIDDVSNALGNLEETINGEFKAGLVTSINLANLDNQLKQLAKEKADIDGQYNVLFNNSNLSATIKQELIQVKSNLDIAHDALVAKINSAISDNLMTEEELKEINALIGVYTEKLGLYSAKAQEANTDIALQSAQTVVDALDQEAIFNKLTNNGEVQGLYLQDGKVYINGEYVHTRNLKAVRDDGTETFKIDSEGNTHIQAKSFYLIGDDTNIANKDYVDSAIENVALGNVSVMLSNEAQVIATSNSRLPLSNQSFTTDVKVYMGTTELTDFTIGTINSANGITVSVNQSNKTITFSVNTSTTIVRDSGSFNVPVISNGKTYTKVWTWALSKQGESGSNGANGLDGKDAQIIDINGEQVFKYTNNFTGNPTPSSIVLTATTFNITNSGKWQYLNGDSWTDCGSTAKTLTLQPTSYTLPTLKRVTVRYIVGEVYDTFTVVAISDGSNGIDGQDGSNGKDGKGVTSITEQYYHSTSMTSQVGGNWSSTVPTATKGKYIWTRSIIAYTDGSSTTTTPICVSGDSGMDGQNGENGQDGVGITLVDVEYANSTSATVAPTSGWTTTSPTWESGKYIWSRTKTTYSNGNTTYTNPACITGQKGQDGINGKDGINGVDGADGVSTYFYIRYSDNANGSPMTSNPTATTKYMGTCSTTATTAPTTPSGYNWSLIKGQDGTNGIDGTNGTNGQTSYLHIKYSNDGKTFTKPSEYVYDDLALWESGHYALEDGAKQDYEGRIRMVDLFSVSSNTSYYLNTYNDNFKFIIRTYDTEKRLVRSIGAVTNGDSIRPATNEAYFGISIYSPSSSPKFEELQDFIRTFKIVPLIATTSMFPMGEEIGLYIGTYVDYTEADSNTFSDYTWKKFVGEDGADGQDGRGVKSITNYYLASSSDSGITSSTSGWTTSIQTTSTSKKYLWNYEVITYTDNSTTSTSPVIIGTHGETGANGNDGKGISSITEYYLASSSGSGVTTSTSGWTTTVQTTTTTNKYLWNYEVITYTDNTRFTGTPRIIGTHGATGSTGASGQDAYTVILTNESHAFPSATNGNIPTAISTTSDVVAYKGANTITPTIGNITNPTGMTITKNGTTLTFQANAGTSLADSGSVSIPITVDGKSFTKLFSWTKSKQGNAGVNGQDGKGVTSIVEQYYLSTSMTSLTGGSWGSVAPTASRGKYIWTRSLITYTDNSTTTTVAICVSGADGVDGSNGANGVSITSVDVEYAQTTSSTTVPTSGWQTTSPTWANGKYIWSRTKTVYSDGRTTYTNPVCITGQKGETGATGQNGLNAQLVNLSGEQVFKYSNNFTGTPTPTNIKIQANTQNISNPVYKWEYKQAGTETWEVITSATNNNQNYYDLAHSNTTIFGSSKGVTIRCTVGNQSDEITIVKVSDGSNGANGTDGKGIKSITNKYLASANNSGITTSSSGWTDNVQTITATNKYLWNYEVITYTDNSTTSTTPVIIGAYGDKGQTGSTGATGVGIKSITEYYLATSSSSGVTTSTSGWTTTVQTPTSSKKFLWNYEVIVYTDNSSYTGTPRIIGNFATDGANGANGADAYTVVLSNESHSFPTQSNGNISSAISITTTAIGYKGATSVTPTIGTLPTVSGLALSKSGATVTIVANTGTSLADTGTFTIPVIVDGKTFNKTFSWSKSKAGATGTTGQAGENAKSVDIVATSQVFKSTDGGKTFSPDTIDLTPVLQNVTYSNWQYSTNGGKTWANVTSGQNGLTIANGVLTVSKSSALYTSSVTSIVFRVNTSTSSVYDTMTIVKLYDVTEMTQADIFNKLTNNGQTQGIFLENGKVYLNGEYMKVNSITADKLHADVLSANSIVSIINGGSTTINGNKITTGTIIADMITSGTFRGTNFIAGGSETGNSNGYIRVLDETDNTLFEADKDGIFSHKITFALTPNYNPKDDGHYWADGTGFYGEAEYDDGTLNSWKKTLEVNMDMIGLTSSGEYQSNTGVATIRPYEIKMTDAITNSVVYSAMTPTMFKLNNTDSTGVSGGFQIDTFNDSYRIRLGGSGKLTQQFRIQTPGEVTIAEFGNVTSFGNFANATEKQIMIGVQNSSMTGKCGMYINTNTFGLYDWQNSRSVLQYTQSTGVVKLMSRDVFTSTQASGYHGFNVNGDTKNWVRTTQDGLLPYASGGASSSLGTETWAWKDIWGMTFRVKTQLEVRSGFGTNLLYAGGTGDGIGYGTNNMRTRCHYGWGISDNGDVTNAVIDARAGRFIGKAAYWHNSSKSLKSDVRAIVSETEPMVARMFDYDTVDNNVTVEMIEDFLDTINVKTYISDYKQEGVTQEQHDDSKAHITQLGYIADEFANHPLFPYIGEMIGEYHAINTTALISAVIMGYQSEKRKRMKLEYAYENLEKRLEKLESLILKGE